MKFVNIETGKTYELIESKEDAFILSDGKKYYSVTRAAFLYWYTTEELWDLYNNSKAQKVA
jgi:hypothetical protein